MKLLIVTSIKEDQQYVASIFEQSQIKIFSATNIIGHKESQQINLLDNWFGSGGDLFDSLLFFSFTEEANATSALELIKIHNEIKTSGFPIRGFILAVEQFSY